MRAILNIFGRSPFNLLQSHMDRVHDCVQKVVEIFDAIKAGDYNNIERIASKISKLEHIADITKQDIRNNLSSGTFFSVDRMAILEILSLQDDIADKAEDIGVLLSLKNLPMCDEFKKTFESFIEKNVETFMGAREIIQELKHLFQSSFGGNEAEKVRHMVDDVAYKEHEVDLLQRQLLKDFFSIAEKLSTPVFYLWLRIFEEVSEISNLSEKLAHRVRAMLDITK